MATPKQHMAIAMSPESSDAVDSEQVTPATKISAYTPDRTRMASTGSRTNRISRAKIPPPFDLNMVPSANMLSPASNAHGGPVNGDPFVSLSPNTTATTQASSDRTGLSPCAAAFTPASMIDSPPILQTHHNSGPELSGNDSKNQFHDGSTYRPSTEVSRRSPSCESNPWEYRDTGIFSSDDQSSRCLSIRVDPATPVTFVEDQLGPHLYPSVLDINLMYLASQGVVYVRFADIRDADKACLIDKFGKIQHVKPQDYANMPLKANTVHVAAAYEGQVLITITSSKPLSPDEAARISLSTKEIIQSVGSILAFQTVKCTRSQLSFRVEFCHVGAADHFLKRNGAMRIPNCTVVINQYNGGFGRETERSTKHGGPVIIGQEEQGLNDSLNSLSLHHDYMNDLSAYNHHSLYQQQNAGKGSLSARRAADGLSTPSTLVGNARYQGVLGTPYSPAWNSPFPAFGMASPICSPFSPNIIGQERLPSTNVHRSTTFAPQQRALSRVNSRQNFDFAVINHNVVDISRIRRGLDVRTTIMLRNIPNKVDQSMLKGIMDETSLGKYDFMYLRIDFANNCNVGYAFINFGDPIWIVDFVKARAGHRWNRYNSDKVAEVSYATIQGRDCLVQKFRNSSVMLEHPSFRPKLFRTGTGPLVGMEEPFPEPDNQSKMRRSVENAEHVGLFAPRAGQNYRDEQRRRRTQYDRGTRMADYEHSHDHRSHNVYGAGQIQAHHRSAFF